MTPPVDDSPTDVEQQTAGERRGPAARDPMAEARRRLPAEVDVVELVSDPPAGPGDGSRLPRIAGGLLAGAVALGGCGSPADSRAAADSKGRVLAVSRDLLGRLSGTGTFTRPPRGGWSGCDDLGGHVAYRVSGRVDAPDGLPEGFLEAVRRPFVDGGVELTDVSTTADPVVLQGDRDDVRVQLTGYAARPVVLLSLTGPCLDVGDADDELVGEAPVRLVLS